MNEKFIHLEKIFHFIICQGSPRENPSVLISSYLVPILPLGPSPQKHSRAAYFVRESQQIQNKKSLVRVPYHKLLNNLAWSSLNGGYSVVFVRISSRFVRTFTTSGPVQPLNSVSEKLIHFSKAIFFLLHIDIVHEETRGHFNTKFLLSKWFRHNFLITRRINNFLKAEKTVTTFRWGWDRNGKKYRETKTENIVRRNLHKARSWNGIQKWIKKIFGKASKRTSAMCFQRK